MSRAAEDGQSPTLTKGQRRLSVILSQIPSAREQLLVALEDLSADFSVQSLIDAATSPDARERNKVAVIEREYEVLLNWCNELAARAFAEGQRLKALDETAGHPWARLAALGVISQRTAEHLREAMELRNELGRAYPPAAWHALHDGVLMLLDELDRYVDRYATWASHEGILPAI